MKFDGRSGVQSHGGARGSRLEGSAVEWSASPKLGTMGHGFRRILPSRKGPRGTPAVDGGRGGGRGRGGEEEREERGRGVKHSWRGTVGGPGRLRAGWFFLIPPLTYPSVKDLAHHSFLC